MSAVRSPVPTQPVGATRPRPSWPDALELRFVVSPQQNAFFHELVHALCDELGQLGVRTAVDTEFVEPHWGTVYVLVPPHEFHALTGLDPLDHPHTLARTIVVCAEQPASEWFAPNLRIAERAGATFDLNPRAVDVFADHGIDAHHLRLGYTRSWDRNTTAADGGSFDDDRPLETLFLGALTPRRAQVLAGCGDLLWRRQARLALAPMDYPHAPGAANFFTGDAKLDLLRSAQTLLNIHRGDEQYFEWLRVVEAFHCGAVVVCDASSGFAPLTAGEHFLSARPETLDHVLEAALEQPELLSQIRHRAYAWLRHHPLADAARHLADAASSLLDLPVPGAVPVVSATSARHDFQPAALTDSHDARVVRQALKDIKLDLIDLRRDVSRTAAAPTDRPCTTHVVASSAAYTTRARPRVSVLVAMYNHAQYITEALDSLRYSRFAEFEVIVVDDGSSDLSSHVVGEFIEQHPDVAVTLVAHGENRGLGRARNTALSFARGEFAFVLDADNSVYPSAIGALVRALDADPAAAGAYGILECFDDSGPRYLLSSLPWQPERLRAGNYIDAMAMVRADVMRHHGGYTTDRRLYGWEDYDLWCALAAAGEHLIMVPNFVARYRSSPTSMVSLSNLHHHSAFAALVERHPALMSGVQPPQ